MSCSQPVELSWLSKLIDWAWYSRCRKTDLKVLWPRCKKQAEERGYGLDEARAAFYYHVLRDYAWCGRYSNKELEDMVRGME